MRSFRTTVLPWTAALFGLLPAAALRADTFTYVTDQGEKREVQARLAGSGHELHALELDDGRMLIVPQARVVERAPGDDPEPIDHAEMEKRLSETFGTDRLVTWVDRPLVMAMVLARPIDDPREKAQRLAVLKNASRFFKAAQGRFLGFVRTTRVPAQPLRFPLAVVIFESDADFERYAADVTGDRTLSAENIAGFYNALSNRLVLRLRECATYEVPLHEFVHMQVHNRGILERMAPVPVWFHEGLATGFEGDGQRVQKSPVQVSERYAQLALRARNVSWKDLVRDDRPFQGDILAGEAYGHAWGMHWLLVTRYRAQYSQFVRHVAEKKPLEDYPADERLEQFEKIVGKGVDELQQEFLTQIELAMRRVSEAPRGVPPAIRFPVDVAGHPGIRPRTDEVVVIPGFDRGTVTFPLPATRVLPHLATDHR